MFMKSHQSFPVGECFYFFGFFFFGNVLILESRVLVYCGR
jgi:hypothetical protein